MGIIIKVTFIALGFTTNSKTTTTENPTQNKNPIVNLMNLPMTKLITILSIMMTTLKIEALHPHPKVS